jgi:transcriptional regulator with GAF, ATPase, and Fis domain
MKWETFLVRLVAVTNRNLAQMTKDKLFRSDLYYRLKVFPITTTPLLGRSEDTQILDFRPSLHQDVRRYNEPPD